MTDRGQTPQAIAVSLEDFLEREISRLSENIELHRTALKGIASTSNDRRLAQLSKRLGNLARELETLKELCRDDFLKRLRKSTQAAAPTESPALKTLSEILDENLLQVPFPAFSQHFLDRLLQRLGGERGFILLYQPWTTEAAIIAAKKFETTRLEVEEYDFSRTLLEKALGEGKMVRIENALEDPDYSLHTSIVRFRIRSVLLSPLLFEERVIGAVYLENNSAAGAFGPEEESALNLLAKFFAFHLYHSRLFPVLFQSSSRSYLDTTRPLGDILGEHPSIAELREMIDRLADSPAPVLIQGETGTGKELVARALHFQSRRKKKPFVVVNCAAIPEQLLESELFGYEKGAFTGALERRIGRIEQASGGAFFLDEVDALALPLQAKLLRFLQEKEINRLGGNQSISLEVRVIAASSKDLRELCARQQFLEALYYRLNVVPLELPPLRARKEDIPLLLAHFLEKYSALYGKGPFEIDAHVYAYLEDYPFPGNVRELENAVHRVVALADENRFGVEQLPAEILQVSGRRIPSTALFKGRPARTLAEVRRREARLKTDLQNEEKALLEHTLQTTAGNVSEAARRLGVHRVTLHRLLKKHGLR